MSVLPVVGTATARMTRVLFIGTALTGIAFAGLSFEETVSQAAVMNPIWESIVTTTLWTLPVLIVALSWRAPLAWLRNSATVFIAIYAVALVTWPFAQLVDRIPDGTQPWIINLLPVTVFAGALILPELAAAGFLLTMCLAAGVLRFVADGSVDLAVPFQDTLFNSMYQTVFVAIIIVTLRAGRHRDDAALRTAADAVMTAAAEAQSAERSQVAALTHDDVISTLLAAARSTPATAVLVRKSADRALERLDALSTAEPEPEGRLSASDLVSALESTVETLAHGVAFTASTDATNANSDVPTTVVRALTEASAEALRNSVRHADSGSRESARVVTLVMTPEIITVEIVDDGQGFDLDTVSLERFGIRFSIKHRMSLVAGGNAEVESTVGAGTRVTLTWERDAG